MRPQVGSADHQVARIAGRQHGVVTRRQLLEAGLSREGVKRRFAKGLLHRVHRGVYRVGHRAPSTEARYMAAVLACGESAVLSGPAAAFLFGLIKGTPPAPEVTTVANRRVIGVTTRRARHLDGREVAFHRAIPITTVPRTVVDLAGPLSLDALARACHEAQVRHRISRAMVDAALARRPNVAGARKLREIFRGEVSVTLSELERRFLVLLRSNGMPLPETNRRVDGSYVDCRWPEYRLAVELDSYRYHHTRHAWEQDRRRDRQARARGDEVRRYTYGDVTEDQALVLAELRELLRQPEDDSAR
jgi:predicted transcriptional regulator of viral defense system